MGPNLSSDETVPPSGPSLGYLSYEWEKVKNGLREGVSDSLNSLQLAVWERFLKLFLSTLFPVIICTQQYVL